MGSRTCGCCNKTFDRVSRFADHLQKSPLCQQTLMRGDGSLAEVVKINHAKFDSLRLQVKAHYDKISTLVKDVGVLRRRCDKYERLLGNSHRACVTHELVLFDFDKNWDEYTERHAIGKKPLDFAAIRRRARADPLALAEPLFTQTLKECRFVEMIDKDTCRVLRTLDQTEKNVVMSWDELAVLWNAEVCYLTWSYYFPKLDEGNTSRLDNRVNFCARDVYCGWSQAKADRLKKKGYLCERQAYIQRRQEISENYNKLIARCSQNFRRIWKTNEKALTHRS